MAKQQATELREGKVDDLLAHCDGIDKTTQGSRSKINCTLGKNNAAGEDLVSTMSIHKDDFASNPYYIKLVIIFLYRDN